MIKNISVSLEPTLAEKFGKVGGLPFFSSFHNSLYKNNVITFKESFDIL